MREALDQWMFVYGAYAIGVVGTLGDCARGWCEMTVGKRSGWVRQTQLWGAGEP